MKTCLTLRNEHATPLPEAFQGQDVRYAESLVEAFLREYTHEGDTVFDPFAGFGTTLVVAERMGRVGFGVEIDPARCAYIRSRLGRPENLICGDARELASLGVPPFDFSLTSPPYMNKWDWEDPFAGGERPGRGYGAYLWDMGRIYAQMRDLMRPEARAAIEVSNLKGPNGLTLLAWDIAAQVGQILDFEGETVIAWDRYGYGYDHSYCLLFRNLT